MRRHLTFPCGHDTLVGTLDMEAATDSTGVLLVSGGRELRAGSWGGQAQLAARLAAVGVPVFRYDRRGIGESEGADPGFQNTRDDIAAALAAFRMAVPTLRRVIAFGNCDAAAALMLHGADIGLDGLVLANPWTLETDDAEAASPTAIRQRYLAKLANPREVLRLLTGGVNLAKLARGMRAAASSAPKSALVDQMAANLMRFSGPVTILLASGDRTAQMFEAVWPAEDARIQRHASSGHSFAGEEAQAWLLERLLEAAR
ncbi:acyl-CoA thioester hydrolase [Novosphingobium sediminis]|uniref:Acyl-CoA thioester hydrolase n=1 Tax=Novosphingobium sediminis TaxID=707214 RepID=A0A512AGS7_9SPHN|nr:hydrolase 1, exosortase A system-associated [Novosphingobium sediminis]GEN98890.1 acyl-CoA thioester hydrolase [Novosphingobium sediminis]